MANDRQSIRRRAQLAASSVSWDLTDWNDACDDAIDSLWRIITRINRDFRIKTAPTLTITDTATNYGTLPSDFMDLRSVCRSPRTPSEEFLSKVGPKTGSMGFGRGYRLEDNSPTKLFIEPYQQSVGTYEIKYIPQAPLLATDGATLDVELQQFVEYVVRHMATAALVSDESDAKGQAAMLAKAEADVIAWAGAQKASEPDQVEDVRGSYGRRWPLPR